MTIKKKCSDCGNRYPLTSEFFFFRGDRNGKARSQCKRCFGAAKKLRLQNSETRARYNKAAATRGRRWRAANPEKRKQQKIRYKTKHRGLVNLYQREWSKKKRTQNPELARRYGREYRRRQRLELYGITQSELDDLTKKQNNVCAICKNPPRREILAIDHDHGTGVVRGLLCELCNAGIGLLRDDPVICSSAVDYLSRHKQRKAS